jgi:hypothetical protein
MDGSDLGVDLGDDAHELVVVDASVSVLVGVLDDLVHFCGREVFSHAGSHTFEIFSCEDALALLVELLEDGLQSGLAGGVGVEAEDAEEGAEVHVARVPRVVDDPDDLLGLSLQAEGADRVHQLLHRDVSAAVVVEHVEHFLQLLHSVHGQLRSRVLCSVESFLIYKRCTAAGWVFDID